MTSYKIINRLCQIDLILKDKTTGFATIFLDGNEAKIYGVAGKYAFNVLKEQLWSIMKELNLSVVHGQFEKTIYDKIIHGSMFTGLEFSVMSITKELDKTMINVEFWRV